MASSPNCTNQWAWTDYTTGLVNCLWRQWTWEQKSAALLRFTQKRTAEKRTDAITSGGVVDFWLPPLTHTDNSLHGDYQCTAWRDWKRSATMITFSHFFPEAPATDEAGHISLHTEAVCCKYAEHQMWSKWMDGKGPGIWMWFSKGKVSL